MSSHKITMIDYGGSNLRSVQKALEYVGATVAVTADADEVLRADKLILPGVGAFGSGMAALQARGLAEATRRAAQAGVPLLGICLGMQFLFDGSEEMGDHLGLGILPGRVIRFPARTESGRSGPHVLKVPHMGWNEISHDGTQPILAGVSNGSHAYFVHSYYCAPTLDENIVALTDYGGEFASIVGRDNVLGIQFHPEKSQSVGLRILQNFVSL